MKMISAGKIVSVELMSMLLAVLCVPSSSLVHAAAYTLLMMASEKDRASREKERDHGGGGEGRGLDKAECNLKLGDHSRVHLTDRVDFLGDDERQRNVRGHCASLGDISSSSSSTFSSSSLNKQAALPLGK